MSFLSFNTLSGRLIWLVTLALLVSQLLLTLFYLQDIRAQYSDLKGDEQLQQIAAALHALENAGPEGQDNILTAANNDLFVLEISTETWPVSRKMDAETTRLTQILTRLSGRRAHVVYMNDLISKDYPESEAMRDFGVDWPHLMVAILPLKSGEWLHAIMLESEALLWSDLFSETLIYFLTSLLTIPVIIFGVTSLTAPLARLSKAVEGVGRGEREIQLPVEGTREIRTATSAFNQMSRRIHRFVDDRSQMLAAISHDLRSPLTGMRLQAEFIADPSAKESIINGIEEMQAMTQALLHYSRENSEQEAFVSQDLSDFVQDLVAQYQANQQAVTLEAYDHPVMIRVQTLAFKRALRNLIDNALKYGDQAKLSLSHDDDFARVFIDDCGSGIAPDLQEHLFEPFTRLDDSRSQQGGGIGLGLSVARSTIRQLGGDIELQNLSEESETGLRVIVLLPVLSIRLNSG